MITDDYIGREFAERVLELFFGFGSLRNRMDSRSVELSRNHLGVSLTVFQYQNPQRFVHRSLDPVFGCLEVFRDANKCYESGAEITSACRKRLSGNYLSIALPGLTSKAAVQYTAPYTDLQ